MTDWVRLWHDMPTDPKWRTIARKSGQRIGDVIAVFNFLMVNASANAAERGKLHGFDIEDVATALDLADEDVQSIIEAMQGKVLNVDRLAGWEKRQPKREDSSAAQRKAEWKERQKNAAERNGTQQNAEERPETETDTETEKEVLGPNGPVDDERQPPLSVDEIVGAWNELADRKGLPKVAKITDARRKAMRARIRENTIEEWREALAAVERSKHCCGDNDRGWRADLDFLLQPKSFTRLIEGFYDGAR